MMYAVVDTNVLISSMITHDDSSPTVGVLTSIFNGDIVPIYNDYLIAEYLDVMKRSKFSIPEEWISDVIEGIISLGLDIPSERMDVKLPDERDIPIYSLVISTRLLNSYLITGNIKHFPHEKFVITPREAMRLLNISGTYSLDG